MHFLLSNTKIRSSVIRICGLQRKVKSCMHILLVKKNTVLPVTPTQRHCDISTIVLLKIITDRPTFLIIQASILNPGCLLWLNFHTCKYVLRLEYQKVQIFGDAECSIVTHSLLVDTWQLEKFITTAYLHQTAKWIITFL